MIETKIYKAATDDEKRIALSSSLIYARWRNLEGCPRVAGFDGITCLQIDLLRWERKNFGLAKSYTSTLGIIEEVGELEDAQDDEDEWADAIGDILIYACNLCSKNGLDFGTMLGIACKGKPAPMKRMLGKLGKLAHVILKADQGIRHYADRDVARRDIGIVLYRVVSSVVRYVTMCGHDPREIMAEVAKEVMKREWWADPGMGVPLNFKEVIVSSETIGDPTVGFGTPLMAMASFKSIPDRLLFSHGEELDKIGVVLGVPRDHAPDSGYRATLLINANGVLDASS